MSWVAGALLFAFGAISILSLAAYGDPLGLFTSTGVVIMILATDLLGVRLLVEIGGLIGVVNFQPKFKRLSAGIAVVAVGLLGSFLFMVVITTAAFLVVNYFFK